MTPKFDDIIAWINSCDDERELTTVMIALRDKVVTDAMGQEKFTHPAIDPWVRLGKLPETAI